MLIPLLCGHVTLTNLYIFSHGSIIVIKFGKQLQLFERIQLVNPPQFNQSPVMDRLRLSDSTNWYTSRKGVHVALPLNFDDVNVTRSLGFVKSS